jgi:Lipocalin-like domain
MKNAGENPLLGTWKLKSVVRELLPTGEKHSLLGEHPSGYTGYSPDGRMYAIVTADNRLTPHDVAPSDEERVNLHRTMVAYAGTYSVVGEKVTHHVDISWNQAWNRTDLIRFYKLEGNTLTTKTAPAKSPIDGREGQVVLVWEKVKSPSQ